MRKRNRLLLLAAVAAVAAILVVQFTHRTIETGAWGLSFRQENSAPIGPASSEELARFHAAYLGNTQQKVIYLTFDAGYENGCTARILDVLQAHKAPAAFFLVGNYMEKNADLVRRMVEEGHTVGNHTMHHHDMSKLEDEDAFARELTDLEALFKEITGKELPKYYRPPQGIYSKENLIMARDLGYKTVFWSLAYVDWNNNAQPTREQAFENCSQGSITVPLSYSIPLPSPMPKSWMNCLPNGNLWVILSETLKTCFLIKRTGKAEQAFPVSGFYSTAGGTIPY